jgi:hypothetical protein
MTFIATLHTGDPGRTGEHMIGGLLASTHMEVTGANAGFISVEAHPTFEGVPTTARPTHIGFWRGPVFIGGGAIDRMPDAWNPDDALTITTFLRFTFNAWRDS